MKDTTTAYTAKGFLGRTEDGARVWIEIELREHERPGQTVEHETTQGHRELSITGAMADKGRRNADSWGQITDDAAQVVKPAPGLTRGDISELVNVWKAWHLNSMQARCAHQGRGETSPCPETGYRYGSAWLVKELPAVIEEWVREFGDKLDGSQARG